MTTETKQQHTIRMIPKELRPLGEGYALTLRHKLYHASDPLHGDITLFIYSTGPFPDALMEGEVDLTIAKATGEQQG